MDIKQLDKVVAADEEGAVITIYQKNGDPYTAADGTPCTMTVVGSESKRYKDAKRQSAKRMLKKRRTTLEPEEVEENAIRQATAAVIAWEGWEADKKPADCTPENVRLVLRVDHIREQVEAAILGHADFFSAD